MMLEDLNDLKPFIEDEEKQEIIKSQYALDETKRRLEKANKKQEEIDNLKYEKDLILENVFSHIKEDIAQSYYNIFRYLIVDDLLWEAWKYSLYKNKGSLEEIEKSHKENPEYCKPLKDFEDSYNFVVEKVKIRLIPSKYKDESNLVEIIDCNRSSSYEFKFKYKDVEYAICVPVFVNANKDNYAELLSGYKLEFKESEHCIGLAFNTMNPNEFKEKLEEWIDNQLINKGE